MAIPILLVEDDRVALDLLAEMLRADGYTLASATSGEEALEIARTARPRVVVTDLRLPGMDGVELLRRLRDEDPSVQVVVVTAFGSLDTAVDAIRSGAFDYVSKPFRMDEIRRAVKRAVEAWGAADAPAPDTDAPATILGHSQAMTAVFTTIARVAPLKTSVLIRGETGTGKELIARAIHDSGSRADKPYLAVNCASLPEGLLESELFGYVRGAFTGADSDRPGLFVEADGGTVLLDEIGDMPANVQAKLLRVLESGEVRAVGSTQPRTVDVRVLAATHRDLRRAVEDGSFRQDLYYRLDAVSLDLPPLRDRGDDILLLAEHFLKRHSRAAGRDLHELAPETKAALRRHPWPGNVRELSHVVERAVALARGRVLEVADLPAHVREAPRAARAPSTQRLDEVERAHILAVLESVDGSRARAAAILGIDRKTLYRKLKRYGLSDPSDEA